VETAPEYRFGCPELAQHKVDRAGPICYMGALEVEDTAFCRPPPSQNSNPV